jgi:hypothetical protein
MEATPERDEIIDFIRNSSRGVMKGYSGTINPHPSPPEGKGV